MIEVFFEIHKDQEGRDWLANALTKSHASGAGMERWRAKALHSASLLAWLQGDPMMACSLGEESVTLWRTVGDPSGLAYALHTLGSSTDASGDYRRARTIFEECITLCRQNGDKNNLSIALWKYAFPLMPDQQEYERARASAEESLKLAREIGNITARFAATHVLGNIAMYQKDYSAAQTLYEKALKLAQEAEDSYATAYILTELGAALDMQVHYERARICYAEGFESSQQRGNDFDAAWQLSGLGRVALHQHDWQTARTHLATSLTLFQKCESNEGIAACLIGLAGVAEAQGQAERAAQLLGAREPLPEISRDRFKEDIAVQAEYDRVVADVRNALGEEAFTVALAKGRAMTLEQSTAYALADAQHNDRT